MKQLGLNILLPNLHTCDYGCGQEGKHYFPTPKKWCCSVRYQKCPNQKKDISKRLKTLWKDEKHRNKIILAQSTPGIKEKKSRSMKEAWNNPVFRKKWKSAFANAETKKKHSDAIRKHHSDLDFRKKQSTDQKERWENDEYRKNVLKKIRRYHDMPETKEKQSKAVKKMLLDPDYKNKHANGINKAWSKSFKRRKEISKASKKRWEDDKWRKNTIIAMKKWWKIPGRKEKLSEETIKRFSNPEERTKQSKRTAQAYVDGKLLKTGNSKQGHLYSKINNQYIFYRSSYELKAYIKIEEDLKGIKFYKNEPFKIPYQINGNKRFCVPDILIKYNNGLKELIEVKPEYKLKDPKTIKKIEAFRRYAKENNMKFSIWTEKELGIPKCGRIKKWEGIL